MRNKKELEKRILELEKLVKDKDFLIEFLQNQLDNQDKSPTFNPIPIGDNYKCKDGKDHDYPFPWHSISPAPCKKCGKLSEQYPITFGGRDTGSPMDFNNFGGNMMYTSNSNLISDNSEIKL